MVCHKFFKHNFSRMFLSEGFTRSETFTDLDSTTFSDYLLLVVSVVSSLVFLPNLMATLLR